MGAKVRLFCFPSAGSAASALATWGRFLPATIEVHAAQLPGRERRKSEPLQTNLLDLTAELTAAVEPLLDRPFALFGHSLGGLFAFEFARQIRDRHGREPVHLFVASRQSPRFAPAGGPIHQLDDNAFLEQLQDRYGALPQVIRENAELRNLFLPILRADMTVLDTYKYTVSNPLTCPITVYAGDADRSVTADGLRAWENETTATTHVREYPGDHFFLSQPQTRISLLAELAAAVASA